MPALLQSYVPLTHPPHVNVHTHTHRTTATMQKSPFAKAQGKWSRLYPVQSNWKEPVVCQTLLCDK